MLLMTVLLQFLHQHLTPAAFASPLPLLLVGAFALASVVLYVVTQGKEFAIFGYAGLLYLIPFVQFN
jgi:hypothetical protein